MHIVKLLIHFCQAWIAFSVHTLVSPFARLPGIPVLYHTVQRNVKITVFLCNTNYLVLSFVGFFGLHIAKGPFGQHHGPSCKKTEAFDDLIQVLSSDKIIIQLLDHIQIQPGASAVVVKGHQGAAVHQDSISPVRYQEGDRDAHIMLIKVLNVSTIIINAFLPLSKTMDMFVRLPAEVQFSVKGHVILHSLQILHKISLAVYGLNSFDNRLLAPCRINHKRSLCQFLAALLQKYTAVISIPPYKASVFAVSLQNHSLCPENSFFSVLTDTKRAFRTYLNANR